MACAGVVADELTRCSKSCAADPKVPQDLAPRHGVKWVLALDSSGLAKQCSSLVVYHSLLAQASQVCLSALETQSGFGLGVDVGQNLDKLRSGRRHFHETPRDRRR